MVHREMMIREEQRNDDAVATAEAEPSPQVSSAPVEPLVSTESLHTHTPISNTVAAIHRLHSTRALIEKHISPC